MKMVQKTKPAKLGIQAASVKPSSRPHLEGKNKTTDLKKKMKRSKLVKLSDAESLKSSSYPRPSRKNLDLPGKPPPFTNPSSTTPIKKQSLIKTIDGSGSPNYMKSTSSSKARTESSQVSSHNLDRRNSASPQSSGSGSGYSNRPAKTLARTSSLKLVRTLTKAPSFKHKRSSRVALCADADVQRSTCSSTMKGYKFPSYLELNHGGTESEGTSVLKVCPYNYCSLNGHHHSPLPPLKSFLSARRRAMKIQKGLKVEALSPRKKKPSDNVTLEKEDEFNEAHISPIVKDGSFDFYIEIYAKSKGDEEGKQESESLCACSEVDFGDNVTEQESVEILGKNDVRESIPISESEDGLSDALDMEWEEEQFSGLEDENGAEFLPEADERSDTNRSDLQLEPVVFSDEQYETEEFDRVDEVVVDFTEGIHLKAGEGFKIGRFENSCTIDVEEGASETSSSVLEEAFSWINEQNLVNVNLANDQLAPVEDGMLEVQAEIQQVEMETAHVKDSQHGICENNCTIDLKEEALEPTSINCPLLSNELRDGCNEDTATSSDSTAEEPKQQVTGPSDYQYETKDDSGIQIDDENESILQKAPSAAKDKAIEDFLVPGINRWTTRRNRSDQDLEEQRDFNPRGPNFLPLVPEPDGEKVDLRHQMMDEKRNAEEWMLDYALRQTVTKLAPAKTKKVALLVEAFEAVMPIPKFESHLRHSSTPFDHGRPIQACS